MIQRIQSVWLLLAALVNVALFYFCLYSAHEVVNGIDMTTCLRVNDHYPTMLIALVTIVLPLVTIFMFKNRKQQMRMAILAIIINVGFISAVLMRVGNMTSKMPTPVNGSYGVGAVLPVIAMIFLFMAIRGIRKDDKLVRSTDRLR